MSRTREDSSMERKEFTKPVHVTTWMAVFLALVAVLAAALAFGGLLWPR